MDEAQGQQNKKRKPVQPFHMSLRPRLASKDTERSCRLGSEREPFERTDRFTVESLSDCSDEEEQEVAHQIIQRVDLSKLESCVFDSIQELNDAANAVTSFGPNCEIGHVPGPMIIYADEVNEAIFACNGTVHCRIAKVITIT